MGIWRTTLCIEIFVSDIENRIPNLYISIEKIQNIKKDNKFHIKLKCPYHGIYGSQNNSIPPI